MPSTPHRGHRAEGKVGRVNDPDARWLARLLWQGAGLVGVMWLILMEVAIR